MPVTVQAGRNREKVPSAIARRSRAGREQKTAASSAADGGDNQKGRAGGTKKETVWTDCDRTGENQNTLHRSTNASCAVWTCRRRFEGSFFWNPSKRGWNRSSERRKDTTDITERHIHDTRFKKTASRMCWYLRKGDCTPHGIRTKAAGDGERIITGTDRAYRFRKSTGGKQEIAAWQGTTAFCKPLCAVTAAWRDLFAGRRNAGRSPAWYVQPYRSRWSRTVQCVFGGAGTECQETIQKTGVRAADFRDKEAAWPICATASESGNFSGETRSRAGF